MKKSVIIALVGVYVFAIVLVGYMGGKMKTHNELIYVDEIKCVSHEELPEEYKEDYGVDVYIAQQFSEGNEVEIQVKVYPADATDKTFDLIYEEKPNDYEVTYDSETNVITVKFLNTSAIYLTVVANDNAKAEIKFRIDCY